MTKLENGILFGCECSGGTCLVHSEQGHTKNCPVIKLVKRNGKLMKVCSRCDLRTDELVEWLVKRTHSFKPYFDYDPLVIALGEQIPE